MADKRNKCVVCGRRFVTSADLDSHMMTHSGEETGSKSVQLVKSSPRSSDLKKDQSCNKSDPSPNCKMAPGEGYPCDLCGKIFNNLRNLKRHIQRNQQPRCTICRKQFCTNRSLESHMAKHHREKRTKDATSHKCLICGKQFMTISSLTNHYSIHNPKVRLTDIAIHKCSMCDKRFITVTDLKNHMSTHNPLKTDYPTIFRCTLCRKEFAKEEYLSQHIVLYCRHRCRICGEGFSQTDDLLLHFRTHTEFKPHKCSKCGRSFLLNRYLENHLKSGICKPRVQKKLLHVCSYCGKTFLRKESLKRHLKLHRRRNKTIYSCSFCGKTLSKQIYLEKHIMRSHSDESRAKQTGETSGVMSPKQAPLTLRYLMNHGTSIKSEKHNQEPLPKIKTEDSYTEVTIEVVKNEPFEYPKVEKTKEMYIVDNMIDNTDGSVDNMGDSTDMYVDYYPQDNKIVKTDLLNATDDCIMDNSDRYIDDVTVDDMYPDGSVDVTGDHVLDINPDMSVDSEDIDTDEYTDVTGEFIQPVPVLAEHNYSIGIYSDIPSLPNHTYRCRQCTETFQTRKERLKHEKVHIIYPYSEPAAFVRVDPYECSVCGKSFEDRFSLASHVDKHSISEPRMSKQNKTYKTGHARSKSVRKVTRKITGKALKCDVCGTCFKDRSSLKLHFRETHKKQDHADILSKPFKCVVCGISFADRSSLDVHFKEHNKDQLRCHICDASFVQKENLIAHSTTHAYDIKYNCYLCEISFPTFEQLKTHRSQHQNKIFHCSVCNKKLFKFSSLKLHEMKCKAGTLFKCKQGKRRGIRLRIENGKISHVNKAADPNTNTGSKADSALPQKKNPVQTRAKPTKYKCYICRKSFTLASGLRRHMISHSAERPYACPHCEHCYKYSYQLNEHMKKSHIDKEASSHSVDSSESGDKASDTFHNGDCITSVSHNGDKVSDNLPHGEDESSQINYPKKYFYTLASRSCNKGSKKSHKCSICNKNCVNASTLNTHMKLHSPARPYRCPQCSKSFKLSWHLKGHMKTHTGVRPYACQYCIKTFKAIGELKRHLAKYHNLKPFKCKLCEQSFKFNVDLRKHQNSHLSRNAGSELFKCTICRKIFWSESGLARHQNNKHKAQPFQCKICYKRFTTNIYFEKHTEKYHELLDTLDVCGKETLNFNTVDQTLSTSEGVQGVYTLEDSHSEPNTTPGKEAEGTSGSSPKSDEETRLESSVTLQEELKITKPDKETKLKIPSTVQEELKKLQTSSAKPILKKPSTTPKRKTCRICRKQFSTHNVLAKHFKTHKNELFYKCVGCGKSYYEICHLSRHVMLLHSVEEKQKQYQCGICNKHFLNAKGLEKHVLNHRRLQSDPFTCDICGSEFEMVQHLNQHLLLHIPQNLKCPVCGKFFLKAVSLKRHMSCHDEKLACHICGKVYSSCWLEAHLKTHTTTEKPSANNAVTASNGIPITNQKRLTNNKKVGKGNLLNKLLVNSRKKNPLKCKICGKIFYTFPNYKFHMNTHSTQGPMAGQMWQDKTAPYQQTGNQVNDPSICSVCGQSVSSGSPKTANVEKRRTCRLCSRVMCTMKCLALHMKLHPGLPTEVPSNSNTEPNPKITTLLYKKCPKCNVCCPEDQFFSHLVNEHHLPIRYKCSTCNAMFSSQKICLEHMKTHQTGSSNICVYCKETYGTPSALVNHMKFCKTIADFKTDDVPAVVIQPIDSDQSNSDETPAVVCFICGVAFTSMELLQDHMITSECGKTCRTVVGNEYV